MTRLLLHPLMFRLIERYVYRTLRDGDSVDIHVDSTGNVVVNTEHKTGLVVPGLTVPTRRPLNYGKGADWK